MLHRNARPGFAVEVKAADRRGAIVIPTREPKQLRKSPRPVVQQAIEPPGQELPPVKPAASDRLLPSLIAQEAPQPAIEAQVAPEVRRPRGRPRKTSKAVTTMAQPEVATKPNEAAVPPAIPTPSDHKRGDDRGDVQLALGQRWKRRLSRWSR